MNEEEESVEEEGDLKKKDPSILKGVCYWFQRKGNYLKRLPYELKLAYQRARYGYDQEYWWQIDYNFLRVVIPQLKDLKENHQGIPMKMSNEEWGGDFTRDN